MKKETKYALLSLPITFILCMIIFAIFLSGGLCDSTSFWTSGRPCTGIADFFSNTLKGGALISVYFFPVYIVIPLITFFITRYFRKKYELGLVTQSDTVHQKLIKVIRWAAVTVILIILLYLWSAATGMSFFRIFIRIFSNFLPRT